MVGVGMCGLLTVLISCCYSSTWELWLFWWLSIKDSKTVRYWGKEIIANLSRIAHTHTHTPAPAPPRHRLVYLSNLRWDMTQASNPEVTLLCFFSQFFFTVTFSGDSAEGLCSSELQSHRYQFCITQRTEARGRRWGFHSLGYACLSALLLSR